MNAAGLLLIPGAPFVPAFYKDVITRVSGGSWKLDKSARGLPRLLITDLQCAGLGLGGMSRCSNPNFASKRVKRVDSYFRFAKGFAQNDRKGEALTSAIS